MGTTKKFLPRDDSWSRPKIWENQNEHDEGASAGRDHDVRYSQGAKTGLKEIVAMNEGEPQFAGGNAGSEGHPGTGGTREERHHIAKELNFNHSQQLADRNLSFNSPASKLESAMREVHNKVPRTVKATGKTGKAKEAMIRAIGFSKAGMSKGK
jgi:hypothetical protein